MKITLTTKQAEAICNLFELLKYEDFMKFGFHIEQIEFIDAIHADLLIQLAEADSQPDFCLVPLDVELEVGMVKFGESGYFKTDYGKVANNMKELHEFVNERNEKMGVSEPVWRAMHSCSMFDCWQNYEKILKTYANKITP